MSAYKENNKKMDQAVNDCLQFAKDNASEDGDQYTACIANARKVIDLKNQYNSQKNERIVKVIGAATSILCVGLMMAFEKSNVITTKSLSFFPKPHI